MMLTDILTFLGLMALLGTLGKLAFAIVNRRKGALPAVDPHVLAEISERLARLEQITESTAVEVERVSEGQRFTTKLLADRAAQK